MRSFLQHFGPKIIGILHGFDRLRFRGTKRLLTTAAGMGNFLWQAHVLLKDFKSYVAATSADIRTATEETTRQAGRPLEYVTSSALSKEEHARQIAQRDGVREGLVCVLSSVEPCWSFAVVGNRSTRRLELRVQQRKCLHYYHYFLDPRLGLLHARLQTWFPFTLHVCLNGREWLARQLDAAGLGYQRRDNCFVALQDPAATQALLDTQLQEDWPRLLDGLAARVNPAHDRIFADKPVPYYWSAEQTEWASDVLFRSAADLAALYPALLRQGIEVLGSRDVLRFLGQRLPVHGGLNGHFRGEVVTDLKERPEGIRIKHRLKANAIKMYNKQGTVLRVETTINDPRDLKVYRAKEGDETGAKDWRRLRKGVADLHRRAEISQKANERYLEAMAAVQEPTPMGPLVEELCRPVIWQGRRVRALNPLAPADAQLLAAISRGEFTLNGFRNRDLRPLLFPAGEVTEAEARRQSAAVTRRLRLLRAHGLIQKVPKTHRYQVTERGRLAITALLAARQADIAKLSASA